MEKNSQDFSIKDAMRLAKSPAAKQLFETLQTQDPDSLNKAMAQAAAGNYAQVRESMSEMLANPQIRSLLEQLGGTT